MSTASNAVSGVSDGGSSRYHAPAFSPVRCSREALPVTPLLRPREVALVHRIKLVAARRGLAHHRVSRVLVDLEFVEGIDDERELHR